MAFRFNSRSSALRLTIGILPSLAIIGCAGSGSGSSEDVVTTRTRTVQIVPIASGTAQIKPSDVALYATSGYSSWEAGAGDNQGTKYDLMPSSYVGSTHAAKLLTYFSISDVHITDKESPAEAPYFGWSAPFQAGGLYSQSYSPVMLSTTQVLDATIRTVNSMNRQAHFEFGLCLGDVANSSQYNELRWFIDVMDGRTITPSSGAHAGASTIDYQKPFAAAGLDRSIPWYEAIGNHDQFFMGIGYPTDKVRNAEVGTEVLNMGANMLGAGATEGNGVYVGVVDGTTPYGDIINGGPTANFATPPTVVADVNRRSTTTAFSTTDGYINEFFNSTSSPSGHGFSRINSGTTAACYSFVPKSTLPLKVIVLDDTCKPTTTVGGPLYYGGGWCDAARLAWLTGELQAGQDAGQLMILACHIPISPQADLFNTATSPQWNPSSVPSESQVLSTLHQYPNLILVMAGHRHMNVVTPQPSPDSAHPENGFWEVETPSLRDFPRNFRTFDILRNADNTISIVTTDVDPVTVPGSPAAKSLGYAIGAFRVFGNTTLADGSPHTYNAELVKMLTPAMQAKIATYGAVVSGAKTATKKK